MQKVLARLSFSLPMLLLVTLVMIGLADAPRAHSKMHLPSLGWLNVSTLATLTAVCILAWVGWRASWLARLSALQPRYWIMLAIALASIPGVMGWNVDYQPVWKTGIPGINIYPGPLSMLAWFGWIASLRCRTDATTRGWRTSGVFFLLSALWAWSAIHFALSPFSVVVALPVAVFMLRRTPWFRASLASLGSVTFLILAYAGSHWYIRDRLISVLAPFEDPLGRNYAARQIRKSLAEAGWFGGESMVHLPGASHQFMLATIGEHWGWFGLLLVVALVTALLTAIGYQLRSFSEGWLKSFALAILGFLVIGSCINLIANLGLTGPAGMGIPFASQNWFLAGLAALLVGISLRTPVTAVPPAPTFHYSAASSLKAMILIPLIVVAASYLGLTLSKDIAQGERPATQRLK